LQSRLRVTLKSILNHKALALVLLPPLLAACQGGFPANADSPTITSPSTTEGGPTNWSAAGAYLAGQHAMESGDSKSAAELLPLALQGDPTNDRLAQQTLIALLSSGRMDDAVKLAGDLDQRGIKAPLVAMTLVLADIKKKDYTAARQKLDGIGDDGASKIGKPLIDAWLAMGTDNMAKALEALKPLDAIDGLKPVVEVHSAMMEDFDKHPELAEKRFLALADQDRLTSHVVEVYADLLHRLGKDDQVKSLLAKFREQAPGVGSAMADGIERRLAKSKDKKPYVENVGNGVAEVLFDLASLLRSENLDSQAVLFGRLALYLNPDLDIAKLLVANLLENGKHYEAAVELYGMIGETSPYHWSAALSTSDALRELGKTEDTLKLLRDMVKAEPTRSDAAIALGDLLRHEKRFDEAAEAYSTAIERTPKPDANDWSMFYFRGTAYERAKKWDKAEPDFLKSLDLSPDQPYVLNYLAYTWVERRENLDKALKMLESAVEQRPEEGFIVDSLGWAYFQLGNFDKAVNYLERAVELQPEDPVLNDHLGDAYWRVGRENEARFQWSRALSFKPEDDQVPIIQKKIEDGLGADTKKTQQDG
jgi:tetratricopeptide (TPR) repeat protein